MPPRKQYTFTRWTFTYHLTREQVGRIQQIALECPEGLLPYFTQELHLDHERFASWVFQVEECPTSGAWHLQGYCTFKYGVTMTAVKKIFQSDTIHLEVASCSGDVNYKYCTKKESRVLGPWAKGSFTGSGTRTDLHAVYDMATQHATGHEMLNQLGAAGMRHLYLYQKTVRVLLDDDEVDKRIAAVRSQVVSRVEEGAAAARARAVSPASSSDDEDDSEDEEFDSGSEDSREDLFLRDASDSDGEDSDDDHDTGRPRGDFTN